MPEHLRGYSPENRWESPCFRSLFARPVSKLDSEGEKLTIRRITLVQNSPLKRKILRRSIEIRFWHSHIKSNLIPSGFLPKMNLAVFYGHFLCRIILQRVAMWRARPIGQSK